MWLYHVPFTICVVSVLEIAFYDKKKSLTIFYLNKLSGNTANLPIRKEIDNNRKGVR
jgi:hypothetical protein